jgi:pimeloyl-ACP methyl ester carboxylesterase
MDSFLLYGSKPYRIAVIHGGPGAPGEMAPVARELSPQYGVIEPYQTALTIAGEVEELRKVLEENSELPAVLIGHSWGAWLSFILAARYPELVAKFIFISSPPFDDKYASAINNIRMSRLSEADKEEVLQITLAVNRLDSPDKNRLLSRFGEIISKADELSPLEPGDESIWCRYDIYESIWPEAAEMRRSGKLLEFAGAIKCPVAAIHGDYDPHPAEGIREPLSRLLPDFRFILLEQCGHTPWNERFARDEFYRMLRREIETVLK